METLIAVLCFVLSLAGYDPGATHFIERSTRDGVDLLDSRIDVRPGIARFRCVRSASGTCHYTLFPRDCRGRGTGSTGAAVCGEGVARSVVTLWAQLGALAQSVEQRPFKPLAPGSSPGRPTLPIDSRPARR